MADNTLDVRRFLLEAISLHPNDISPFAVQKLGITRQAINRHLRTLTKEGLITATGATRGRQYKLVKSEEYQAYPLDGTLQEDKVWRDFVFPLVKDLPKNIQDICQYGFTEMLNNAIDHSEGNRVIISVRQTPVDLEFILDDNGIGIFRKIKEGCGLEDERHAILELSKGKLTTDPKHHTGEGIFFTSRMFDRFSIYSGKLYFSHTPSDRDWLLEHSGDAIGTQVTMVISKNAERIIQEVFDRFTADEEGDYGFDVTHVPVALARYGDENLVSRSQAKRLVARFDRFKKVGLDFKGVTTIGQAFADEIFRVFQMEHPDVKLMALNTSPQVQQMIRRACSEGAR